ncbi:hypothetical protein JW964_15525 [candidate division KSB1 bacterium]|nr:hypothetical protein [candidate division KSB1 bacterium]
MNWIDRILLNLFKKLILFSFIIYCAFINCQQVIRKPDDSKIINFAHLQHLTETVQLDGKACDIVHIYSEYPDYRCVDANEEGIACVDDVARAAVVYLRYFKISRDSTVLAPAKRLLNFILFMQAEDGEFYNFIDKNLKINKTGQTSQKSFNFWAARGYWVLGAGYRIFQKIDDKFALELKNAFLKCQMPVDSLLKNFNQYKLVNERKYPRWLINETGTDATAELLLGIAEFLKADTSAILSTYATQLAEGILFMQQPNGSRYTGAFLSWEDIWHAWGNSQTQALAEIGMILNRKEYIDAAQREADEYSTLLITNGYKNSWSASDAFPEKEFPQIAYDIRCLSVGLLRLFQATGDEKYAKLAGLAASWHLGNNVTKIALYDSTTGRCYDGINDSTAVNLNSGAESTIEALYTLVEISSCDLANKYLYFKRLNPGI